ncbi:MAG: hypothetical protein K0S14_2103 [Thermomicrobiales bacterium]|jgi:hypothetical protein|nr:hypothetical protein [Thermomicrobiales bacterium]
MRPRGEGQRGSVTFVASCVIDVLTWLGEDQVHGHPAIPVAAPAARIMSRIKVSVAAIVLPQPNMLKSSKLAKMAKMAKLAKAARHTRGRSSGQLIHSREKSAPYRTRPSLRATERDARLSQEVL